MIFSLLEKLIDYHPEMLEEGIKQEKEFIFGLIQDIENLLNTQKYFLKIPSHLKQIQHSVINYGTEDLSILFKEEKEELVSIIRKNLSLSEPRLNSISVYFNDKNDHQFIIEAEILVEKVFHNISFQLDFLISLSQFRIELLNSPKKLIT